MRRDFVCARITSMNRVNLRRFQFDYDTTWNAFFLDERLNVYSRYGGRDQGEPDARLSKESLLQTMREVLAVHQARKNASPRQRKRNWQPVEPGVFTPRDIPLLKKNHQGCVHCHQVREYMYLQSAFDKTFSRRDIYDWPLPENIGISFDRKHGHRVRNVDARSAAAKAGLKAGDVVTRLNGVPVHSEYDVRWVLGRSDEAKPLRITLSRAIAAGKPRETTVSFRPPPGWMATEIGWRKSLRSLPLPFGMRGYALTRSQRKDLQLPENRMAIRVVSVRGKGLAGNLGLHKKDTVVALGDDTRNRTLEELKSDLVRRYRAGDVVRLTVLREGKRIVLSGRFPKWVSDETSVP
jgi:serine protease Do